MATIQNAQKLCYKSVENVRERVLSNIDCNTESFENIDMRGSLLYNSTGRSQVPFDIDTFITVISEKIDSRISESV